MRMLVRDPFTFLLGTFALVATCGSSAAETLTLEECVSSALIHNVAVADRFQGLQTAEANVMRARSAFFPSVQMGGSWTKPEERIEVFQQGTLLFFDETWSARANASLTVFDGWGNVSGYQEASRARSSARDTYRDARQEVVYQTELRFFEVLKQQALLDVQRDAVRLSEEQLKKTRAMKDLGAATLADVYKAQVDHSNNRLAELRTGRDLAVGKATLAEHIGRDPREPFDVAARGVDEVEDLSLEAASGQALEVNSELSAAKSLLESSEAGVRAAKSSRYPAVGLFYDVSYFNFELKDFDDEHVEYQYGVNVSFNIFDGFLTKSNIRRAQAAKLFGERNVEVTERKVLLDVQEAYLDLEIAKESIGVAQEAVQSSEEDLRLAQERYKIGEGTILDVIDAQVNLTRSRTELVNATYDQRLASSALRNAMGSIVLPETRD
jgi:outer membrane protein TolC